VRGGGEAAVGEAVAGRWKNDARQDRASRRNYVPRGRATRKRQASRASARSKHSRCESVCPMPCALSHRRPMRYIMPLPLPHLLVLRVDGEDVGLGGGVQDEGVGAEGEGAGSCGRGREGQRQRGREGERQRGREGQRQADSGAEAGGSGRNEKVREAAGGADRGAGSGAARGTLARGTATCARCGAPKARNQTDRSPGTAPGNASANPPP
jgi:hypothetical protein